MRRLLILLPLLLSLCAVVQADDKVEHGDWTSQFMDGMGEATTHENGMSVFGMLCSEGICRYYFANSTECEQGSTYPMMVTTNSGAISIDAVCEKVESANGAVMLYWFSETDMMNQAFRHTPVLGFAFPLTNGQFKISTFSMDGFNQAIERMTNGLRERAGKQKTEVKKEVDS